MLTNTAPLHPRFGKADAVWELATRSCIPIANRWDPSVVPSILEQIRARLSPVGNEGITISTAEQLRLKWAPIHSPTVRSLIPAVFTNGRPTCFGDGRAITAFSPGFKVLSIPDGYVGHFFGATLAISSDGRSIVEDVSSRYCGLYHYYDFDAATVLKEAPFIDGIVIPIADDIRPLNFCHWLVDWLPRLEFLGSRAYQPSVYVVTTPLIAEFQRDSLKMCGFDESRVIALDEYHAVRARELLIPGDLRQIPHPIFKGAPWAVSFLRSTVGMRSIMEVGETSRRREKLYISRADATRRRIVNDPELAAALAKFGYRVIELSSLSLAEQVSRFAYATHIIGLHGAGLSSLVFSAPGTQVIEIFPQRYGKLSFAVIAAAMECPYATYIADTTVAAANTQSDDVEVDVSRFLQSCGHLI